MEIKKIKDEFLDKVLKKVKKLDDRSLMIHHKTLKRKSAVKITNPKNGIY